MFSLSEDGEFEKPSGRNGGGRHSERRSRGGGGARRSYQSSSRFYCRPGRQYINEEAENYAVMMSSKYRIFDRHGPSGHGNLVRREGNGRWNRGSLEDEWLEENMTPNGLQSRAFIQQVACEIFLSDDENSMLGEDESEDEVMTLDEYEKLVEDKKKAFRSMFPVVATEWNIDENFNGQGQNEPARRADNTEELDNMEELAEDYVIVTAGEDF